MSTTKIVVPPARETKADPCWAICWNHLKRLHSAWLGFPETQNPMQQRWLLQRALPWSRVILQTRRLFWLHSKVRILFLQILISGLSKVLNKVLIRFGFWQSEILTISSKHRFHKQTRMSRLRRARISPMLRPRPRSSSSFTLVCQM